MSTPLRMCVVCRQMKEKAELLRVVKNDNGFSVDPMGKAQGRGAYICKAGDCCEKFEKQRSFERAFRCTLGQDVKEAIKKELI